MGWRIDTGANSSAEKICEAMVTALAGHIKHANDLGHTGNLLNAMAARRERDIVEDAKDLIPFVLLLMGYTLKDAKEKRDEIIRRAEELAGFLPGL